MGEEKDGLRQELGEHYCEAWLDNRGVQLRHINMYRVGVDVGNIWTMNNPSSIKQKETRLFYAHNCSF